MDLLNFVVLAFEIIYYSLFMKSIKREGKFWEYVVIFILITLLTLLFGNKTLLVYWMYIFIPIILMKYIFKIDVKLFDIFMILLVLIVKIIIEGTIVLLFKNLLGFTTITFIFEILKILVILLLGKIFNKIYLKGIEIWNNNNFYIRYFTSILLIIYTIITVLSIAFF